VSPRLRPRRRCSPLAHEEEEEELDDGAVYLEAVVLAQLWAGVVVFLGDVDGEGRVRDIAVPAGAEEEGRLGVQIRLVRRPAAEVDVEPEELAEHPDVFCSAS